MKEVENLEPVDGSKLSMSLNDREYDVIIKMFTQKLDQLH